MAHILDSFDKDLFPVLAANLPQGEGGGKGGGVVIKLRMAHF